MAVPVLYCSTADVIDQAPGFKNANQFGDQAIDNAAIGRIVEEATVEARVLLQSQYDLAVIDALITSGDLDQVRYAVAICAAKRLYLRTNNGDVGMKIYEELKQKCQDARLGLLGALAENDGTVVPTTGGGLVVARANDPFPVKEVLKNSDRLGLPRPSY